MLGLAAVLQIIGVIVSVVGIAGVISAFGGSSVITGIAFIWGLSAALTGTLFVCVGSAIRDVYYKTVEKITALNSIADMLAIGFGIQPVPRPKPQSSHQQRRQRGQA